MSAIEGVDAFINRLEFRWAGCRVYSCAVSEKTVGLAEGTEKRPLFVGTEGTLVEVADGTSPLRAPLFTGGDKDDFRRLQEAFENGLRRRRQDGLLSFKYGLGIVELLRYLGIETPGAVLAVAEIEFDTQERALVFGVQRSSVLATPVYSYPDRSDSKVGRAWFNSLGGSGSGLGWRLKVDCLDGNEDAKGGKRVTETARIGFGPVTFELPYSDDWAGGGVRFSSPLSDMLTAAASHLPVFAAHRQMIARSEINGRKAGSRSRLTFSESCTVRVVIGMARSFSEVFAKED